MQLLKPLGSLLLLASLSGCASKFIASDWAASITLPASEDCYSFHVLSAKETRIPADDPKCILEKATSIRLTSENYKLLRRDLEDNCQLQQCTQIKGRLDELFLVLNQSLERIQ